MRRIAFFGIKYFPSRGGTSRVVENLILQLRNKYDITIYCYSNPQAKDYIHGVKVVEFKPVFSGALGAFFFLFLSTMHLLFKGSYDLVHVHKTDSAFFIPLIKLKYKVIATSHEAPYTRDKWNRFMKFYFHKMEFVYIKFSDKLTCISKPLTEFYERRYGKQVFFIPNGITPVIEQEFDFERAVSLLPTGASMEKPFILFAARRLMRTKGCHTMLEALKKIHYKDQIFIAGELDHNSKYLKELKKLSKDLNVHFLGFISPLTTLLALVYKSQFFVFPSETEGMSIMLLEVASVGKPVIVSDIPENTQIFHKDEVIFFRSGDANDLAEKIKYMLENEHLLDDLGKKAKEKVEREYNWENISDMYAQLYNDLLEVK